MRHILLLVCVALLLGGRAHAVDFMANGEPRGAVWASSAACSGTSDGSSDAETAIAAATAAGRPYYLPSGCRIGLGSPGAGGTAVDIPTEAVIICQDNQTAGFFAQRQRCTGGTYPGAHCETDAECIGGGTCDNDFGTSSSAPCTGSTCFAPSSGSTYYMLRDTANGQGVTIMNCGFWTYQADGYQRCDGGSQNDYPCRSQCATGSQIGYLCEVDADCAGGGTCGNRTCDAGVGDCDKAPEPSSGPGSIEPIDLTRTTNVTLRNNKVYDRFKGAAAMVTARESLFEDNNVAATADGCTSPEGFSEPSGSICLGAGAGSCCYGGYIRLFVYQNTQPTTQSGVGIKSDYNAVIRRNVVRGSTYGIDLVSSGIVADNDIAPLSIFGPGTPSGTGIRAQAGSATIRRNRQWFMAADKNGIEATARIDATDNDIQGLNGSSSVGIKITTTAGNNSIIAGNSIKGAGGRGMLLGADGTQIGSLRVANNLVESSPATDLLYGIQAWAGSSLFDNNILLYAKTANADIEDGWYNRFVNNVSQLTQGTFCGTAYNPVHLIPGDVLSQFTVTSNVFVGGCRGLDPKTRTNTLTNTNVANNRFIALAGAATALGGAGVRYVENYYNPAGGTVPATYCDPTCSLLPGLPCNNDADCGTCSSTYKCTPDPVAFFGMSPAKLGTSHAAFNGNILYQGNLNSYGQCTGSSTNVGQICGTAASACADSATCSGTPATCQSGSEVGKRCCTGTPTCTKPRQPWDTIRFVDAAHGQVDIIDNELFNPMTQDFVLVNLAASGVSGAVDITGGRITGNQLNGDPPTSTTSFGVKFDTASTISDLELKNNHSWNLNALYTPSVTESWLTGVVPLWRFMFDYGPGGSIATTSRWFSPGMPFPALITSYTCEGDSGTSFTTDLCVGEDVDNTTCATSHLTGTVACGTTPTSGTLSSSNRHLAKGAKMSVVVSAVSTPPQYGYFTVNGVPED